MTNPRRRATTAASTLLAGALLAGCASSPTPPPDRSVNVGFENVIQDHAALRDLADNIDRVGATRVAVSAGRPEWSAFPWEGHEEFVATAAAERDLIAEALDVLAPDRSVTLMVDMLAPATVSARPDLAGQNPRGESSSEFLSLSEITEGEYAQRAVDFVAALASRYQPDAIGVTELMFDDFTFGEQDLAAYRRFADTQDWPRDDTGAIDVGHPSIGQWRSAAIAQLVGRMADAAHAYDVRLIMDVRANFDNPLEGRPESGHDYARLLEHADALEVWAYVGLSTHRDGGGTAREVGRMSDALSDQLGADKVTISVGLWGSGSAVISADELRTSLEQVSASSAAAVSVTPASLLDSEHWSILTTVWGAD